MDLEQTLIKQTPPRPEFSILINRDLRVIYLHEHSRRTALIEQTLVVRWATGFFLSSFQKMFFPCLISSIFELVRNSGSYDSFFKQK